MDSICDVDACQAHPSGTYPSRSGSSLRGPRGQEETAKSAFFEFPAGISDELPLRLQG
jgi:hypothetical protein